MPQSVINTRDRLKWFVRLLLALAGLAILTAIFGWNHLQPVLNDYEQVLKFIGYLVGPIFAVAGFVSAISDRLELRQLSTEATRQEEKARRAAEDMEAAKRRADTASASAQAELATSKRLREELKQITTGSEQLWRLRPPRPFEKYEAWLETRGARTLSFVNLKGGVGKTTLAANFAAYVSETLHKRVLVVDLDYQGSLSNMMMLAVGRSEVSSNIDRLLAPSAGIADVLQARVQLVPQRDNIDLRLSQAWLVPASYDLNATENRMLLEWLLAEPTGIDVRYRLAHVLLEPDTRRDYDLIIFDLPPRLTLGAINALVASEYMFVPTVLDMLSVEAVPTLLSNVSSLREEMGLKLELAGVIGTMTNQMGLTSRESDALSRADERASATWRGDLRRAVTPRALPIALPRKSHIASVAGESLAYLVPAKDSGELLDRFDQLFSDMASRIGLR